MRKFEISAHRIVLERRAKALDSITRRRFGYPISYRGYHVRAVSLVLLSHISIR